MSEICKRPQVIRDLIDIATYLAENNLENSDRLDIIDSVNSDRAITDYSW